jgi:hypothetical protein
METEKSNIPGSWLENGKIFIDDYQGSDKNIGEIYNAGFYGAVSKRAISAQKVISMIANIFPSTESVVDIGCGNGVWLKTWQDVQAKNKKDGFYKNIEVLGLDGNTLDDDKLFVPRQFIKSVDITKIKFEDINRKFDIAESIEFAEHVDEEYSDNIVDLLTSLSDIVLFSAAIPYQAGTHHVNCQPPYFWSEKFNRRGFLCFDIVRPALYGDDSVACWYQQNVLLYVKSTKASVLLDKGFKSCEKPHFYYHPSELETILGLECSYRATLLHNQNRAFKDILVKKDIKYNMNVFVIKMISSFIPFKNARKNFRNKALSSAYEKAATRIKKLCGFKYC